MTVGTWLCEQRRWTFAQLSEDMGSVAQNASLAKRHITWILSLAAAATMPFDILRTSVDVWDSAHVIANGPGILVC
jgi:hypothetical protein